MRRNRSCVSFTSSERISSAVTPSVPSVVLTSFPRAMLIMAGTFELWQELEGNWLGRLGLAERGEPGVNRLNDDRSLADSGGDSLHRARADVTHREDARQVGLKDVEGHRRIGAAILSCPHEPAVVQPQRVFEPSCAGVRTDHDEQAADGPRHHASFAVADLNGSKMFVA